MREVMREGGAPVESSCSSGTNRNGESKCHCAARPQAGERQSGGHACAVPTTHVRPRPGHVRLFTPRRRPCTALHVTAHTGRPARGQARRAQPGCLVPAWPQWHWPPAQCSPAGASARPSAPRMTDLCIVLRIVLSSVCESRTASKELTCLLWLLMTM